MHNSKYDALLDAARNYVTVKPVDTPRTIFLVEKAKGDRSFREFSAAVNTSIAFVSYILNRHTIKINKKTIAGLVNGAAAESGVTLDVLMDAQGRIQKQYLNSFEQNYRGDIRRILIDELMGAGYTVEFGENSLSAPDPSCSSFTLQLHRSGETVPLFLDFKIRICPFADKQPDIEALISSWLDETVAVSFAMEKENRSFLVVDNPILYQKILEKVGAIRIPNEISILLVSPQKRKVISESMIPLSGERKTTKLFPQYEAPETEPGSYPFADIYLTDVRSLLADQLLGKGYAVRFVGVEGLQPTEEIGKIQPDITLAIEGRRRKPFHWAFLLLPLPEDADTAEVKSEIRNWISGAIVYYYLGGKCDRLSLVVDNEQIYNCVLEEFSTLQVRDQISLIWISFPSRQIVREYIIPYGQKKDAKDALSIL